MQNQLSSFAIDDVSTDSKENTKVSLRVPSTKKVAVNPSLILLGSANVRFELLCNSQVLARYCAAS